MFYADGWRRSVGLYGTPCTVRRLIGWRHLREVISSPGEACESVAAPCATAEHDGANAHCIHYTWDAAATEDTPIGPAWGRHRHRGGAERECPRIQDFDRHNPHAVRDGPIENGGNHARDAGGDDDGHQLGGTTLPAIVAIASGQPRVEGASMSLATSCFRPLRCPRCSSWCLGGGSRGCPLRWRAAAVGPDFGTTYSSAASCTAMAVANDPAHEGAVEGASSARTTGGGARASVPTLASCSIGTKGPGGVTATWGGAAGDHPRPLAVVAFFSSRCTSLSSLIVMVKEARCSSGYAILAAEPDGIDGRSADRCYISVAGCSEVASSRADGRPRGNDHGCTEEAPGAGKGSARPLDHSLPVLHGRGVPHGRFRPSTAHAVRHSATIADGVLRSPWRPPTCRVGEADNPGPMAAHRVAHKTHSRRDEAAVQYPPAGRGCLKHCVAPGHHVATNASEDGDTFRLTA